MTKVKKCCIEKEEREKQEATERIGNLNAEEELALVKKQQQKRKQTKPNSTRFLVKGSSLFKKVKY